MQQSRHVLLSLTILTLGSLVRADEPASEAPPTAPAPSPETVTIQLKPSEADRVDPPIRFTARFTAEDLTALLLDHTDELPLALRINSGATRDALERVNMGVLAKTLAGYLAEHFPQRFDPGRDLISKPVETENQVALQVDGWKAPTYSGPRTEIAGFLIHDVTEREYIRVSARVMQTARQLLDSGDPLLDRQSEEYYRLLAQGELDQLMAIAAEEERVADEREQARRQIGAALGVVDPTNGAPTGKAAQWLKETRRYSYIVKEGKFIERLRPVVQALNTRVALSGFSPPNPLDQAGVHFDPDLGDVDIVLPRSMVAQFLELADGLEKRMAEDYIISIEAVRLTDREIVNGAVASRLNAQVQGVHDVQRFNSEAVIRRLGLNSLMAVANQQLQLATLRSIATGAFPDGVGPVTIASPELPGVRMAPEATTIGSTFSVGADDIFFDGREQRYGFSYVGPDGIEHSLSLDIVDSLREFWDRIERNLIVHKIKKDDVLTKFTVPVGPETKTYEGLAALISQEDQQLIVATGTGAISEISATAGTWLVINDFEISPIPGSSTTLSREENEALTDSVLMTMLMRDPLIESETKLQLLEATDEGALRALLQRHFQQNKSRKAGLHHGARVYEEVFEQRELQVKADAAVEKKERNSIITLNFFSSQGNIIQSPGATQLGAANDLTSFTTELRPNMVTPISSFFTRQGSGATGTSPLSGIDQGEQRNSDKTMTHLVIRARFPNAERERRDLEEGRHLGYFKLPLTREHESKVELPLLSSSEHPLDRLAGLRFGLIFETLNPERVRKPFSLLNPNRFPGTVREDVHEAAMTRMLMMARIIADSPGRDEGLTRDYKTRFIIAVRSLLEYDEDFFDAPNFALRNLAQWNDPDRISVALNNSPNRFALDRLIAMLDEIGVLLIPDEYDEKHLARARKDFLGPKRLVPLTKEELRTLRRDVAIHFLRTQEACGDAFLEATSNILGLGTYRNERKRILNTPLHSYRDLVIFARGGRRHSDPEAYEAACDDFLLLKDGGYRGKLFEPSFLGLEHMAKDRRKFVRHGPEILEEANRWQPYRF